MALGLFLVEASELRATLGRFVGNLQRLQHHRGVRFVLCIPEAPYFCISPPMLEA
jgi:hypothetical protein